MRTKLSLFCDKTIEAGWLAAVVIVPLFFNIYSQRVFEPDKLSLLRSIAVVMSAAWVIRWVEDRRTNHADEEAGEEQPSFWKRVYKTPLVLPTLLLVLVYLVSSVASVTPRVSFLGSYQRLQGTYTTLSYIVIFFLALDGLRSKRQLNRLINTMVFASFPIAVYGLVQHFGLDPLPWGGNVTTRVASNMGNAIFVAAYLIMVVPLTVTRLLENWKKTIGEFEPAEGILGAVAFVLLVGALIGAMILGRRGSAPWLSWVVLLGGAALSAAVCLFRPPGRRAQVLAISLPLTFAFLVGFVWVLEIPFPPADSRYFGWGIMASGVFLLAMIPFAYYLRKPVSRLLLLAGYFVILIAQVVTIFYTQSRGPLLGFLAGVFVFFALLGLMKRRIWLPWLMSGATVLVIIFLVIFNTVDMPLMDTLRDLPYVGRLGKVLQTESGTGKVRILIWEGAVEMIGWHAPLEYPGAEPKPDALNALRPLIGYGPESMYVAYNRFYPPDLAHFEKRNASPDRSHNETFDALVITGWIGFLVYMLLFTSVFYYGLKWLGLIKVRWQKLSFLGLWVAGGIAGAIGTWAWQGPAYVGVGIPLGVMMGLAIYVGVVLVQATFLQKEKRTLGGRYGLWMLALLSAIVAHFVEIHLGIAIAATRTYFWVYAALMVVIGTRLALQPAEAEPVVAQDAARVQESESEPRRKRRRGPASAPLPSPRVAWDRDWQGSILVLSVLSVLILSTLLFDFITIQQGDPGLLPTIWESLTESKEQPSLVMLGLLLIVWGMIALMGLNDLALRKESAGKGPQDWLAGLGIFALISLGGASLFALFHASRLKPVTITSVDAPNPLSHTITFYYVFVFAIIFALAGVLAFAFRRSTITRRWSWAPGDVGLIALTLILGALAIVIIFATNISIIRADILYKQGLSSEKAAQWEGAIYFYDKAISMAKEQDFYYLFLGRALMEKGKATPGQERDLWLEQSEQALLDARAIEPLNTDHSANLARLYRTWGGLNQGDRRTQLLSDASDYYADATSLSPNNAQLHNEWGQTYYVLGERDKALEMYEVSLAIDSQYGQTYLLLGEFFMQEGDWDKAIEAYNRAIQVDPNTPDAYSSLGYVYTQKGDLEAALEAYLKAVELRPNNFNNRKNLAIVYQQLGRIQDAITQATRALELAPESQKPALETFLAQLGQPQSTLPPQDAQQIQELMDQGRQEMDAEDWQSAEQTYRQVVELDIANPLAHSALAYIYAKLGQLDEAITENLVVLDLMPNDYNSYKNLAILYQQKGDLNKAQTSAEQALTLAPEGERPALEDYIAQLKQMQGESTTMEPKGRAGDLPTTQRNNMYSAPPPMTIDPTKSYQATIVTKKGNIVVDLAAADAPQTVNNFVYLAEQGFYDGLTFHRVESQPGFSLIQGGDPTGTGRGGPGYTVPAEIGLPHDTGAIATARLGDQINPERASSGSQFYICREPIHQLDGGYTVFGYIVEGLDVAQEIAVADEILTIVISAE
jgi:tetratricopeptide (TPR) repeat protein/cyclophilin family peptidyl-prolyl cis-trans isomerase